MEISEVDRFRTLKNDSNAFSCLVRLRKMNGEHEGAPGTPPNQKDFHERVCDIPFDAAMPSINLGWGAVG